LGGAVYTTADQLIQAVDVVCICSPTPNHKDHVMDAARAGKPIFCEKPLARTVADAEQIVKFCERQDARLFVGHVLRFFPQYIQVKRLIDAGEIGEPRLIRLLRTAGHPTNAPGRSWFQSTEKSGGVIMEGGIHDLDFARWCFGEVEQVFARGITYRDDLDLLGDHVQVMLRFKSGVLGQIEGSWLSPDGSFRQQIEVVGSGGMLSYDSLPPEQFKSALRSKALTHLLPGDTIAPQDDGYFRQLEHFLACLHNDAEFRVTPRDGLEAVRLANAALDSMRTGRVIKLGANA
jgi:predicted dehydrogenase